MLYQPTSAEITAIIEQGIAKQPTLSDRYRRAADILNQHNLYTTADEWFCTSQSQPNHSYAVNGTCTCPDYQSAGAAVQGHIFCKHKLALEAYRRILERHLEQRIIGNAKFRSDRELSRLSPNTYLPQLWETNQLGSHSQHGQLAKPVCAFRWSPRGRTFASDADLARFATWLATAHALPTSVPDAMATDADLMDYHAWHHHWFAV
jgi:hypothetical protein